MSLVGKTIKSIDTHNDDYIEIIFTDGTLVTFTSGWGDYGVMTTIKESRDGEVATGVAGGDIAPPVAG